MATGLPESPPRLATPLQAGLMVAAGALGTSSVAPALPSIAGDLGLGLAATAAVVSAYTVPFATSTIIGGQLVDRYGPRAVMRPATATALIGVLLAATAGGAPALLAGRALQGIGAAMVTVTSYAVARRRPGGLATTAAALTVGSAAGPLFGGLASELLSWRAAVAVPVPLLLLGLVVVLPRGEADTNSSDRMGTAGVAVGATLGAAALQLAGMNPIITVILLPLAVVILVLAGRRSVRGRGHVPAERLLRDPQLRMMAVLRMVTAATYFATIIIVPVGLGAADWGPVGIGLLLLPPAVSGALSSRWSDQIARRLGRWTEPTAAALILFSVALVVMSPPVVGALSITVLATAFGMIQPRLMGEMAAAVRVGPATALGTANLVFLLGGGIGAATIGGFGSHTGGIGLLVAVALVGTAVLRRATRERETLALPLD